MSKVFPQKAGDKSQTGNKHSLGYSFNFIRLILASRKPRQGANDVLNRVIDTQCLMYSTYVEEELCTDIQMDCLQDNFIQDDQGNRMTFREYLMSLKQHNGKYQGNQLFISLSRESKPDEVVFQFLKAQRDEALNTIYRLPLHLLQDLSRDPSQFLHGDAIDRAGEGTWNPHDRIYKDEDDV